MIFMVNNNTSLYLTKVVKVRNKYQATVLLLAVPYQRRYDTVDLYSGVNANYLLRIAFQAHDQIAAFLSTCTVVACT